MGAGHDSIEAEATAESTEHNAFAAGISQAEGSAIDLGTGNDTIKAQAIAQATSESGTSEAVGILGGTVDMGGGKDKVEGTAIAKGKGDVAAFGQMLEKTITKGGKDTLKGYADARSKDVALASGIAVGLAEDVFLKKNSLGQSYGLGAEAGVLDTGDGNDTVRAGAKSSAFRKAIARGIDGANGVIDLGAGNDTIEAQAIAKVTSDNGTSEAVGIFGGTIDTGDGKDFIKARSNDNLTGSSGISLDGGQGLGGDVNINLGNNNDRLLGFGNATVDAGDGTDTLLFEFSLREFIVGGGSINFSTGDFTFGGVTLKTDNFERFQFNVGIRKNRTQTSFSLNFAKVETFDSLADLEIAVGQLAGTQPALD
ncbi:MAG: hypothetical protein AB4040_09090, partial [Synechococcus sp.]